jgi:predicted ATPase/DNA-binding CsgD family transcriptional regulator
MRTNVLPSLSSCVGREQEVLNVTRLLHQTRLITLAGTGGVGKTRLAIELSDQVHSDFPGGVWLVELAPIVHRDAVARAVAHTVGVREDPGQPVARNIAVALAEQRTLLILDNCEHLLVPCAELVDHLLRVCNGLHILATSREPLEVEGEYVLRVAPLPAPDPAHPLQFDELERNAAVRLFVQRAEAVQPDFKLTPLNAAAVATICWQLDGLPLALELAASRIRALSPDQVAERLADRFRLLAGGARMAPARHQTLRAAIAWSHELLSEPERTLFRRLSVFAGGWTLEAAEHACAGDEITREVVLDLLTLLVSKSLVLAEQQPEGVVRFRMLVTIRQFAADALVKAGEHDRFTRQTADYYVALACDVEVVYETTLNHDRLTSVRLDWGNFDAAWDASRPLQQMRLAVALHMARFMEGKHSESRDRLLATLPAAADAPLPLRARALIHLAHAHMLLGDADTAEAYLARSKELCGADDSIHGLFNAIRLFVAVQSERMEHAADYADEALPYAGRSDVMRFHTLLILVYCGIIRASSDRLADGSELFKTALMLCQGPGTAHLRGYTLFQFGRAQAVAQDFEAAADTIDQALRALELTRDYSITLGALRLRGQVAEQLRDFLRARSFYHRALRMLRVRGSTSYHTPWLLVGLAGVSVESGHPHRALLFLAAFLRHCESGNSAVSRDVLLRSERLLADFKHELSDTEFQRCWTQGQMLDLAALEDLAAEPLEPARPAEIRPILTVRLTDRQLAVLKLVAQGQSNREIALALLLSEKTVGRHLENLFDRLGVSSRSAAAAWAVRAGLA